MCISSFVFVLEHFHSRYFVYCQRDNICTSSETGALNVRVCELITGLVFVPWGPNSTDLNRHSTVDTDHYFDNFDHFGHVDSVAKRDI